MGQQLERTAIVTGAGQGVGGLGRAIAGRFAEQGFNVVVADLDPAVEETATEITRATGRKVGKFAGNLSQETEVAKLVDSALSEFGRVDVLVNNAGGGIIKPFLKHDAVSLTETLARNLWTTVWCCHKVLPLMVKQNYGRIVNIGADSLRTGIPQHAGYNAAKGGVIGLAVGLAREFASYDITINTVSPCVVNTERHRARLKADPKLAEAFVQVVPKARGVEIEEVVDLVYFLAQERAGFITGQDISINGGSAMP
jgi:2,3-dihydroxy-2,3-dihydro-p-cumate dehydrogenase